MRAHDHSDHDHEHEGAHRQGADADAQQQALPHLLRAAAAGRTDVVGPAGFGVLQRLVGNSGVGAVLQREVQHGHEHDHEREDEHEGRAEAPGAAPRSSVHDVVGGGGGEPLDAGTRTDMESRLGADFGDVRVHTDSGAHASAAEVGARAYTVGNDIVFQRDAYDTASDTGRTTLAHELTHVMQQRQGPVDGTETAGGIRVSDPSDRFEREASANAERVMAAPSPAAEPAAEPTAAESGPAAEPASAAAPAVPAGAAVQREEDDTASSVQREPEKKEDEEEEAPPES
ncbi:DUF4157 domain-containing protein [Streptomyces sp. NRRL F-5123]|uniref:eCIS core domain-containing protein n=1 Tax=Streptomyces sp. NRRL F-5123 TaxID=1463856 RepID=UPI0004E23EE7|nr:DUF4157 domain-containing protein [Streptomyces sp. NRRL F-5123]